MRISDWSSDVCSSDLTRGGGARHEADRITLDVFAQHHVDDAGHRIGAVNGRSAAAQDIDALDHRPRNGGHVHEVALAVVGLRIPVYPTAIEHEQRITGVDAAKIDHARVRGEAAGKNPADRSSHHTHCST